MKDPAEGPLTWTQAVSAADRASNVFIIAERGCFAPPRRDREHTSDPTTPPAPSLLPNSADLRNSGLKATLPRLRILELFERSSVRHLSAEDIYRALGREGVDVGLATVYRVLTQFEQAGLLQRHRFESDKAVFELNDSSHHDHLVCLDCGRVEEFVDEDIEIRQAQIAGDRGFLIQAHSLYLYAQCRKRDCEWRDNPEPLSLSLPGDRPVSPQSDKPEK